MFCSKCNEEIVDDSRFCKFCGSAIEAKETLNSNEMPSTSASKHKEKKLGILPDWRYFNTVLSLSSRPTVWLKFYAAILALGALGSFINCVSKIVTNSSSFLVDVIYVIAFAFYLYTFLGINKMSPGGYIANIIVLCYQIIESLFYNTYFSTLFYLLFGILNLVYFIKRKNLFFDKELHKAALEIYMENTPSK